MGKYAVVNPATGETVKEYPEISDEELAAAIAAADEAHRNWSPTDLRRRARRAGPEGRRASHRAARDARRDHRARDGQADRAGPRRGRLLRRHLRLLRRQRRGVPRGRADRAAGGRRHRRGPQDVGGPAARDHALELPLLPGGPLRRPEPGRRQHDPAQAGAPVPRVGRGDPDDVRRRRLPRRRLPDDPRLERPDRRGDRRPAGPGRLADRLRAGRRRRRRDRRAQPEEGRARARRLRPVHPARRRRPRRSGRGRGRRPARQHRPVLQRREAVHRRRRALRRLPREVHARR